MNENLDNLYQQNWIKSSEDLGQYIRAYRKSEGITLETASGLSNVSTKFLSEFERGKETAEIGKVLKVLTALGLNVIVQPRKSHVKGSIKIPLSFKASGTVTKGQG